MIAKPNPAPENPDHDPAENAGWNTAETDALSSEEIRANILLVDDREDKRLAMQTIIAGPDRNVVSVSSGKEALRCLLNNDFAVILLDVNMPGMDGFETAHLIRQRKNSEHTPIIFVTGISDTETHVSRGYSLGAVDYILTPVLPEVLRTKVTVFVESFKKTEQLKRQAERLRQAHEQLELRVEERTAELAVANQALQAEVAERQRIEEKIRKINGELEQRVLDRTAELALANEELEAFSYSVAHDLQAPLRNIESYAQMLEEDFPDAMPAEAQQYLSRIRVRSRHLAQLVSDLLNLSRLGKKGLNREEVDLAKAVNETVANVSSDIGKRCIEWQIGELGRASCDPNLLKQVFANLLSNAVKFSQPREKAIIEIGLTESQGEPVFFVRDNGVGFDMRYADKLFGVFQRLHPSGSFEGTGVGLATAARIIRKHGGRIWAEAEEDKGATFYFTLGQKLASQQRDDSKTV
ncbi:MAG TPA: ATP-binding protein [Verrucomicrobiae bacterium]|nr:ATP-binding protein [Verrucomicrobiae bacterium]